MQLTVNGIVIPVPAGVITANVTVDPTGETLPFIQCNVTGGKLEVYRSRFSYAGNVSLHLFGANAMSLPEWPSVDQAAEAATICCDKMDGKDVDCELGCKACWTVHGYALAMQHQQGGQYEAKAPALSDRAALEALKSAKGGKKLALNIDWKQLASLVLTILQQILGGITPTPAP